jgi:CheY-like chemotaxis protein
VSSGATKHAVILCIDDDIKRLELRKQLLEKHGFQVLTATTPMAAIEELRSHEIDLILTEQELRLGTAGELLTATLRTLKPDVPIVIFSGAMTPSEADLQSANAFVSKLVTVDELMQTLNDILGERSCTAAKPLSKVLASIDRQGVIDRPQMRPSAKTPKSAA